MANVFSIHEIELRPGIGPADFETFLTQEYIPGEARRDNDWKVYYLKGDRGRGQDTYVVLFVFESVEVRDRFFPPPGQASPDLQQFFDSMSVEQRILDMKFDTLATPTGQVYTDYIVIEG